MLGSRQAVMHAWLMLSGGHASPFVSAIVARGARFFLLAWLLRRFGEEIRDFLERRLSALAGGAAAILICLFAAHRLFY